MKNSNRNNATASDVLAQMDRLMMRNKFLTSSQQMSLVSTMLLRVAVGWKYDCKPCEAFDSDHRFKQGEELGLIVANILMQYINGQKPEKDLELATITDMARALGHRDEPFVIIGGLVGKDQMQVSTNVTDSDKFKTLVKSAAQQHAKHQKPGK
jgi:hypothetical protein